MAIYRKASKEKPINLSARPETAAVETETETSKAPAGKGSFDEDLSVIEMWFFHIGVAYTRFLRTAGKFCRGFYRKYLQRHMLRLDQFRLRLAKWCSKIFRVARFGAYQCNTFVADAYRVVRNGYRKREKASFFVRMQDASAAFFQGLKNNSKIFTSSLNYVLPLIALAVLFQLIHYVRGLDFAVSVQYNGEHVGYIQDETVYEDAETKLQERLLYQEGDQTFTNTPQFTVMLRNGEPLKSGSELTDTIIQSSQSDIAQATGVTIDGQFYGAVRDGSAIREALGEMLDAYSDEDADRVEFTKDVDIESGLYLQNNIVDEKEILNLITGTVQGSVYYTVVEGDTPSGIASQYDMSLDELVALNPDILTKCPIGKQVLISKEEAFLPVKTIVTKTYSQAIDYETEYTTSANLYEGMQSTVRAGKEGSALVTAEISYVDGVEVGRTILSSVTQTEPVNRIVAKGTMKMPVSSNYTGAASSYGFVWPVTGGYISQYYKGTYHNGIDIAFRGNGYGRPIYAALPGTVVQAGWSGTYGNLVVISHGNGTQTWYAHCSKLNVSVGQSVSRGQQIANVGSTGRSTGNHLHFRVIVNGVQQNPLNYLP
jgi:murein DD-endopeptidase MepM/ murein hydrolase activator NlpD